MKNVLGHLAYVLEGVTRIFDIPSYNIRVIHDGDVIEDEFIYGMFYSELCNHEYCVTGDLSETLDVLGLTVDEVNDNPAMLNALHKAAKAAGSIEW